MERSAVDFKRIATLSVGVLLWLQLAAGPLSSELSYPDADWRRIVVGVLPLVFLVVAALTRSRLMALLFFPTSFAAVLVVAPPGSAAALESPSVFPLAALSLVIYAGAASTWLRTRPDPLFLETTQRPVRVKRDRWRPYRATFLPRAVLMVGIFCVSAAAVPLYPPLAERVARSFWRPGEPVSVEQGLVLCSLATFFIWAIVAYGLFFSPAVEGEARIRHLETRMQASISRTPSAWRRLGFALNIALGLGLMVALVLLR
jgi:hypothetical protein